MHDIVLQQIRRMFAVPSYPSNNLNEMDRIEEQDEPYKDADKKEYVPRKRKRLNQRSIDKFKNQRELSVES